MIRPKVLDLFSGGKSLQKPCEDLGFDYFSIDIDPTNEPDRVADVGLLVRADIPFNPDIIWASPPCTCFSVASFGKHWQGNYKPKTKEAEDAIKLVNRTLSLLMTLGGYWFVENPRGMMRKLFFTNKSDRYVRHTVTYCQYGDKRMKPTDIWTNNKIWVSKPMCKNGDPCHNPAPRGSTTGTQGMSMKDKWHVPYNLLCEILESCGYGTRRI